MKLYLDQTGDTQGVAVTVSSGTYSAQCVDDAFWIAPSCRGNHSQCVVMLTGGLGWGVNEMMQKATAFNMPFAVASVSYLDSLHGAASREAHFGSSVHSQVASIRIADAMARLELIGRLPSAQRGKVLVSDTQASLYCAGGVIYNKSQLLQVSRAAARALNGSKNPRMCIARSREATHLVGVGLTRTHAPAAIIVTFVKELWRLLAMQCISSNEWEAQYQRRRFCAAGLPRFIEGALRATGIRWSSAFS